MSWSFLLFSYYGVRVVRIALAFVNALGDYLRYTFVPIYLQRFDMSDYPRGIKRKCVYSRCKSTQNLWGYHIGFTHECCYCVGKERVVQFDLLGYFRYYIIDEEPM